MWGSLQLAPITVLFILIAAPVVTVVDLTSTLNDSNTVTPQQTVTFTCVLRCNNSCANLRWSSAEYIGTGDQYWEFGPHSCETVPATERMNDNAIAECLSADDNDNGQIVIVSQLNITVSPNYTIATVTCSNNGNTERNSTTFCKCVL